MEPKLCEKCESKGLAIDSRQRDGYVSRRYHCKACDIRWSTIELRLSADVKPADAYKTLLKDLAVASNEAIADKLIELAQELLYGTQTSEN